MRSSMSSRERMLCAINHEEPDHVPLYLRVCGRGYFIDNLQPWHNQFERVNQALGFGLDDTVGFVPELNINKGVRVRRTIKKVPGERRPVLVKVYETPKGTLRQVVRQTSDWIYGDDIPIFSDYNVPNEGLRNMIMAWREYADYPVSTNARHI